MIILCDLRIKNDGKCIFHRIFLPIKNEGSVNYEFIEMSGVSGKRTDKV